MFSAPGLTRPPCKVEGLPPFWLMLRSEYCRWTRFLAHILVKILAPKWGPLAGSTIGVAVSMRHRAPSVAPTAKQMAESDHGAESDLIVRHTVKSGHVTDGQI